jgi:EAL and modified HD-GYP domain-containing signal transduction protein
MRNLDEGAIGVRNLSRQAVEEACYIVRQPVLDRLGRVRGYDVLFRNTPEALLRRDAEFALETLLDNQMIFGLERLTNSLPAFVSCTAQALLEDWVLVLNPALTVLSISAVEDPPLMLRETCDLLKGRGFKLALDNYGWSEKPHPLLHLADYVRVDFRQFRSSDQQQLFHRLQNSVVKVAQHVETEEDHAKAIEIGFTLFQGEYVCHPVLLRKRKLPANRALHLGLVRELYHNPLDIGKVSEHVRHDASLTYRLLRLVNSPFYGLYCEVRSVDAAIVVLGETTFRRVVMLAVLSEINMEHTPAILQAALVRARFCELAAQHFGLDPAEQYLLGLLSLLPAMLGASTEETVATLPLRKEICESLCGTVRADRKLLGWLECYERAEWDGCDRLVATYALDPQLLAGCYFEAVRWASTLTSAAS